MSNKTVGDVGRTVISTVTDVLIATCRALPTLWRALLNIKIVTLGKISLVIVVFFAVGAWSESTQEQMKAESRWVLHGISRYDTTPTYFGQLGTSSEKLAAAFRQGSFLYRLLTISRWSPNSAQDPNFSVFEEIENRYNYRYNGHYDRFIRAWSEQEMEHIKAEIDKDMTDYQLIAYSGEGVIYLAAVRFTEILLLVLLLRWMWKSLSTKEQ
jgi:hypothetical protein